MNVLFVVAHPDDEALGGGATIAKFADMGYNVDVAVLNTFDYTAYGDKEKHQELLLKSDKILGVRHVYMGDWEDSCMNKADHREMVVFIEKCMKETKPQIVFTHHPADVNEDHRWVFQSAMEAFRIGQRQRYNIEPIEQLLLMEVQSSTDWGIDPTKAAFRPNTFIEVSPANMYKKITSMLGYEGVIRNEPHPRSVRAIESLASYRGAQAGFLQAEAFECVFRREK